MGYAVDNQLSIQNYDSPYTDYYSRSAGLVSTMADLSRQFSTSTMNYDAVKDDAFLEDLENYSDLKILRMNRNERNSLDLFLSFCYGGEEYYGVYKDYNNQFQKSNLKSELFSDPRFRFDVDYLMKLDNYIYGLLEKWFRPKKGNYKVLDTVQVKDNFGRLFYIKINSIIECMGWNVDEQNCPYVIIKYKEVEYTIDSNNYYWFNYKFEKLK